MRRVFLFGDSSPQPPDWSAARALILYAQDESAPVRAFERDAADRWVAVALRRHALEFQVEPSASERTWSIGWEWNGLFAVCVKFTNPAPGDTLQVELHAPVEGARLAWAGRDPGRGGELPPSALVPLADALPALVLR